MSLTTLLSRMLVASWASRSASSSLLTDTTTNFWAKRSGLHARRQDDPLLQHTRDPTNRLGSIWYTYIQLIIMQQAPQLSQADAKSALDDAIAAFQVEENKQKILKILADVAQLPPEQQVMARMMQVLPAVQEIQQNALEKYGFNFPGGAMQAMMQIQVASQSDPDMAAKVKQLMSINKATLTACSNSMLHNFLIFMLGCIRHMVKKRILLLQGRYSSAGSQLVEIAGDSVSK